MQTSLAEAPAVTVFTDPVDGTQLVTIPDAAKLSGVQTRAVYRYITQGRIRVRKLAGSRRMRVELASLRSLVVA